MDDLKLYAKDDSVLEGLLRIVKGFNDIGMEFGLSKCPKSTFKRGILENPYPVQLDKEKQFKIQTNRKFISTLTLMSLMGFNIPQ